MTRYVVVIWLLMFMGKWVECNFFQCGFREVFLSVFDITVLHFNLCPAPEI